MPDAAETTRVTAEVTVSNKLGLHARPAALFVRTAQKFPCHITVEKDGEEVNGKSIMGLMMLAAGMGSVLKITAIGDGAQDAIDAIKELVARKFDED